MTNNMSAPFTERELEYLVAQRLGRLATISSDGVLQNNPVGFRYNSETRTIDIGGRNMGATRKFRNVEANGRVAFVVDDIVSVSPWRVRGIEIRGHAEALRGEPSRSRYLSNEIIRIHPERVISWGVDPEQAAMRGRDVHTSQ
jgi:pyridoxamine 5'-phosphate oxidase family protein